MLELTAIQFEKTLFKSKNLLFVTKFAFYSKNINYIRIRIN